MYHPSPSNWQGNGGPQVPKAPLILTYMENDITNVKGKENMQLFQLRQGGASTRLVATCCHSTLAVDHAAYSGNVVMVPQDSCKLVVSSKTRPSARIQEKWWKAGLGRSGTRLKPFPPEWGPSSMGFTPWWFVNSGLLATCNQKVPPPLALAPAGFEPRCPA